MYGPPKAESLVFRYFGSDVQSEARHSHFDVQAQGWIYAASEVTQSAIVTREVLDAIVHEDVVVVYPPSKGDQIGRSFSLEKIASGQ